MINAEMVQASVCNGKPIYTLDVQFPRTALAEFLTHRVMSKNTASTRAIPIESHVAFVRNNPYIPDWTKNQAGMQGGELSETAKLFATDNLMLILEQVCDFVEYLGGKPELANLGIHKQDAGRYLEPFSYITLRVTATEWKNFLWLRDHYAAYPPIQKLAQAILKAIEKSEPFELLAGEYHLPDITRVRDEEGVLHYYSPAGLELSLQNAIDLSMSLNAQQSYRKADDSMQKAESIKDKLFGGNRVHASPSEHIAIAVYEPVLMDDSISIKEFFDSVPEGITHITKDGSLWSANFRHWIQYRQLLPNHDAELMP